MLKTSLDQISVGPSPSSGELSVVRGDPGALEVGVDLSNMRAATQANLKSIWNVSNKLDMKSLTELHGALNTIVSGLPKTAGLIDHLAKCASDLDEVSTDDAEQAAEGIEAVLAGCVSGDISDDKVMEKLMAVAGLLDDNYKHGAADLLDKVVLAYEYKGTPMSESRKDLYDSEAHNAEGMWELAKREIAENRSQDSVETHRDVAPSLSTRYSPDLPGVQCYPIGPGVQQDSVTHKIYDWNAGFTLDTGSKIPGGSVAHQTPSLSQYSNPSRLFDTRVELSKRKASVAVAIKVAAALPEILDSDVEAMREWARDCQWGESDTDPDFIDELSADEIISGIKRNYDGGLEEFLRNTRQV